MYFSSEFILSDKHFKHPLVPKGPPRNHKLSTYFLHILHVITLYLFCIVIKRISNAFFLNKKQTNKTKLAIFQLIFQRWVDFRKCNSINFLHFLLSFIYKKKKFSSKKKKQKKNKKQKQKQKQKQTNKQTKNKQTNKQTKQKQKTKQNKKENRLL